MTKRKAREECQVPTYPFSNQKKKTNVANSMEKSEEPWLGMETTGNNDFKWIDGASLSATFSALSLHVITGILTTPTGHEKELHCFQGIMVKLNSCFSQVIQS